jgi:hypothetical protein
MRVDPDSLLDPDPGRLDSPRLCGRVLSGYVQDGLVRVELNEALVRSLARQIRGGPADGAVLNEDDLILEGLRRAGIKDGAGKDRIHSRVHVLLTKPATGRDHSVPRVLPHPVAQDEAGRIHLDHAAAELPWLDAQTTLVLETCLVVVFGVGMPVARETRR